MARELLPDCYVSRREKFAKAFFGNIWQHRLESTFPDDPVVLLVIPAGLSVPDIFLSYSREDQPVAHRYAEAFQA